MSRIHFANGARRCIGGVHSQRFAARPRELLPSSMASCGGNSQVNDVQVGSYLLLLFRGGFNEYYVDCHKHSYNAIDTNNGAGAVPACGSDLLMNKVYREAYLFSGYIVSGEFTTLHAPICSADAEFAGG